MTIRRAKPRALVERPQALAHAQMAVRRAWAGGIEDMQQGWTGVFNPEAIIIHDLNGEPLFYEFSVMEGRTETGRVKAAASKLVGSPVVTIERGPRKWDPAKATKLALEAAKKAYPRREAKAQEFVCYCYPKIGVRVELAGEKPNSIIVDVADGTIVQSFGEEEIEGQTAYSFLESRTESGLEKKLRRYEELDREIEVARKHSKELFAEGYTARELVAVRSKLLLVSDYIFALYSSRVLKYGPRCSPHDCFALYAQQTNVYCAVATGQMILDFHRRPFSQDAIATAMGTGATGTSQAGQDAGYISLTNGCMDAAHDFSANWTEAKSEIDANRPLKSGIPGHARAVAGWKQQNFSLIGSTPKRWLQVYDPWPWNADICAGGAVYWEDWDAVNHTNWCFVRNRTDTH
ncbi:C39 family peptidase [Elioraea rosea]|uniref:C39 family peptidase n=1 Tax=Elioraea rosea TaxID=2492390 RepID=UPI0011870770|nr:C39 family peptidase [Elioraea rosea]